MEVPDIDMFASRLNKKLLKYASWKPDPESYITDCVSKFGKIPIFMLFHLLA